MSLAIWLTIAVVLAAVTVQLARSGVFARAGAGQHAAPRRAVRFDDEATAILRFLEEVARDPAPVVLASSLPPMPSQPRLYLPHACPDVTATLAAPAETTATDMKPVPDAIALREHIAATMRQPARSRLATWVDEVLRAAS